MKAQSNAQPCTGSDSLRIPPLLVCCSCPTPRECHGGEKTPLPHASPPSPLPACRGGSWETDQANSITGPRLLGSPVSSSSPNIFCLPPTHSIPWIPDHAKCNSSSRPWQLQLARLQLLSLVLKAPAFRPARLLPRPEPSRWSALALNSISWL